MNSHYTTQRGYSAEEVKAIADERGLPCRILDSNGLTIIKPQSTLETLGLVRVWSRFMTVAEVAEDTFDRIARAK